MIRKPQSVDFFRLNEIERQAATLFPTGRVPLPTQTLSSRSLTRFAASGLLFIANVGDQTAGFAAARRMQNFLHLVEVSVDPAHGRQGIGRALVERVVSESRLRSLTGTTLTTFADVPWNGPFYQSVGFRVIYADELPGWLSEILEGEKQQGLTHRVAMQRTNP